MTYLPEEHFLPTFRAVNMLAEPGWKFLVSLAALKHGVQQRDIIGPCRTDKVCAARWEAMSLIYRHTNASMPTVGRWLGKDHTTVLYGLRKCGDYSKLVDPPPEARDFPRPTRPPLNKRVPRTALQRAVVRAYEHHVPRFVVAEAYGCSADSIGVLAHRMGLRRADYRSKSK